MGIWQKAARGRQVSVSAPSRRHWANRESAEADEGVYLRQASFCAATAAALILLGAVAPSRADTIVQSGGSLNSSTDFDSDTTYPTPGQSLTTTPYNDSTSVNAGGESSTTAYAFSGTNLNFSFDHTRGVGPFGYAQSIGSLYFTVDAASSYSAAGSYSADDVNNSTPGRTYFEASLRDETANADLFYSYQDSRKTPDQSFTLGGLQGDDLNSFTGSLTGTLVAGHTYRLYHYVFIDGYPLNNDSGATAGGYLSLGINAPNAVPLPGAAWAGLVLLAGMGSYRFARRNAFLKVGSPSVGVADSVRV